jgi:hypothetical protein
MERDRFDVVAVLMPTHALHNEGFQLVRGYLRFGQFNLQCGYSSCECPERSAPVSPPWRVDSLDGDVSFEPV